MVRIMVLAAVCVFAGATPRAPGAACLPVAAPVIDGFRPPPVPWSAGNRGLTFGTTAGQPVRAVASGRVHFAGTIAGEWYVSVEHGDGTRVTYSFLGAVAVSQGEVIEIGGVVGAAGPESFQLGWRDGDRYLDPASLITGACPGWQAILVPVPPG